MNPDLALDNNHDNNLDNTMNGVRTKGTTISMALEHQAVYRF